jgi:(5-formylfuran-3-yl)methyl phosphate synthase
MTLMLASVSGPNEAEIALVEGADIIDLKDPAQGAFSAVSLDVVRQTLESVAGRRRVSAVCGELPMDPPRLVEAVSALAATGVDFVKLGILPDPRTGDCIAALAPVAQRTKLMAVLFADVDVDLAWLAHLAHAGFAGAMIDTARKSDKRLIDHMTISALDLFVQSCRQHRLMAGLAGALEAPDVPRLLLLAPDFLGFRGALCTGQARRAAIAPANVRLIRDLIPRADLARDAVEDRKVDWRFLAARGYSVETDTKPAVDRVFVHDLILPASIGAYEFEQSETQRVRFNIDVDVRRATRQTEDMRDVFSYDLIVDAIRLILSRGHVALVETLAEEIMAALFAHPRVVGAVVRVEKLDVIDGSVGVELRRDRAAASAQWRPQTLPEMGTTTVGTIKKSI